MSELNRLVNQIKDKKLLILGFGREGKSTFSLLRQLFPHKTIGIADSNQKIKETLSYENNLRFHLGNNYLQSIKEYDLIFKSPGVSLKDFDCRDHEKITSQTDLFLRYFGRQTIGVTGTKGKSTTASLIEHILKENNKKVVLLGNIGIPAFDKINEITPDTIVVFELSAHQLEYVHSSPKVAVLLNIFPEHLDHFKNFDAYKKAKLNIAYFQQSTDALITSEKLKDDISPFRPKQLFYDSGSALNANNFLLKGEHNLNNIKAAIMAVEPFGVNNQQAMQAAQSFKPLPHRLEYVGKFGDIHFYNDSISTIPQSAVAAIKAIGKVDTLILGGFDRGLDYSELIDFLTTTTIKNIIFTGPAGKTMYNLFLKQSPGNINLFRSEDVKEAFEVIKKHTSNGGICLLSPAAASYDRYHNFEHRGDVFKALAQEM